MVAEILHKGQQIAGTTTILKKATVSIRYCIVLAVRERNDEKWLQKYSATLEMQRKITADQLTDNACAKAKKVKVCHHVCPPKKLSCASTEKIYGLQRGAWPTLPFSLQPIERVAA